MAAQPAVLIPASTWTARADEALACIRSTGADASMTVAPGEVFCVMNLSGSGKSTLVCHINRLLEPTAGRIVVDGSDIIQLQDEFMALGANMNKTTVFITHDLDEAVRIGAVTRSDLLRTVIEGTETS